MSMQDRLRRMRSAEGDVRYFKVDVMFNGKPMEAFEKSI